MYAWFNYVEAVLWVSVAIYVAVRIPGTTAQQRLAIILAVVAFIVFGLTDVLEAPRYGRLPPWLWGMKIACGAAILAARYTYIGWSRFKLTDREVLFALGCLLAVLIVMALQRMV